MCVKTLTNLQHVNFYEIGADGQVFLKETDEPQKPQQTSVFVFIVSSSSHFTHKHTEEPFLMQSSGLFPAACATCLRHLNTPELVNNKQVQRGKEGS